MSIIQKKKTLLGKTAFSKEQKYVSWNDELSLENLPLRSFITLMEKEVYEDLEPAVRRIKKCGYWSEYRVDYADRIYHLTKVRTFGDNSLEDDSNEEISEECGQYQDECRTQICEEIDGCDFE